MRTPLNVSTIFVLIGCRASLYYLTRLHFTLVAAVALGGLMDLVAKAGAIPSLMPYYRSTKFFASIVTAGIIPMLLVWTAKKVIFKTLIKFAFSGKT